MADQERPPVGSVAEEAARLLDALGGWAASAGYAGGAAPGATNRGATDAGATDAGAADAGAADAGAADGGPGNAGHCDHCGAENGAGRAVVCGLCPVCQGIGVLRSVRPETVDRLADLVGAIAGTLRDLADHRRAATGSGDAAPGPGPSHGNNRRDETSGRAARARVQDIVVDDETTATS